MKSKIKNIVTCAAAFAIVAVMATGAMGANPVNAAEKTETKGRITVTGEGKVAVSPDVAYLRIGVTTQNEDSKAAQNENSEIMAAIIAAVKEQDITDSDIQTSDYYMYPNYSSNGSKITGYSVNNVLTVTVKDLTKVGVVLDAAIDNGGNLSNGIQFGILDSSKYYEEALALAVTNAMSKGAAIAKAIGKSVGTPVKISETGGSYMPYMRNEMAMTGYAAAYDQAAVSVQAGELDVTANITVEFEY